MSKNSSESYSFDLIKILSSPSTSKTRIWSLNNRSSLNWNQIEFSISRIELLVLTENAIWLPELYFESDLFLHNEFGALYQKTNFWYQSLRTKSEIWGFRIWNFNSLSEYRDLTSKSSTELPSHRFLLIFQNEMLLDIELHSSNLIFLRSRILFLYSIFSCFRCFLARSLREVWSALFLPSSPSITTSTSQPPSPSSPSVCSSFT